MRRDAAAALDRHRHSAARDAAPAAVQPDPDGLVEVQVVAELERRRGSCESDGCEVMYCVQLCMVHGLMIPDWLCFEFIRRHNMVDGAHVLTWDLAFGRPWPLRTRLASERRQMRLTADVHAAVFSMVCADIDQSITRDLFECVGELDHIELCGAAVEKIYYTALGQGMFNVATWRDAQRAMVDRVQVVPA